MVMKGEVGRGRRPSWPWGWSLACEACREFTIVINNVRTNPMSKYRTLKLFVSVSGTKHLKTVGTLM